MVKMTDVAKHAGVSVATVSNVITGKNFVSDELRKAVEKSIEELGYKINLVARGLKANRTFSIGVVLPDITRAFFPNVLKGIQDAANESNYNINFISSGYDFKKEKMHTEQLKHSRVDGIIIDSCCTYENQDAWARELVELDNLRKIFPVVSLEQEINPNIISSITIDNNKATQDCVDYLTKIGRTKILYVAAPQNIILGVKRLEGYKKGLIKARIPVREELIFEGDFSPDQGYKAILKAISKNIKFDAVLAANDQMAIGALKALKENKIKVPDEVAVIGFDNLFPGTLVSPAISTIDVPRYKMGYEAFQILKSLIEEPDRKPIKKVLKTEFVERQSSNSNCQSDWSLSGW